MKDQYSREEDYYNKKVVNLGNRSSNPVISADITFTGLMNHSKLKLMKSYKREKTEDLRTSSIKDNIGSMFVNIDSTVVRNSNYDVTKISKKY